MQLVLFINKQNCFEHIDYNRLIQIEILQNLNDALGYLGILLRMRSNINNNRNEFGIGIEFSLDVWVMSFSPDVIFNFPLNPTNLYIRMNQRQASIVYFIAPDTHTHTQFGAQELINITLNSKIFQK